MTDDNVHVEMVAAIFPNTYEARAAMNDLVDLHTEGALELVDAAVMVREYSGNLSISERAELTPGKGARRGALIGAALGVIFPPSLIASAAIGAAAGAITGKKTDQGFENEMLEEIGGELEPGKSAILAVVESEWYDEMMAGVEGYERLLHRALAADEAGRIVLRE